MEFAHDSVAPIAAEAMNNYLMFNKVVKCQVVPKFKVHPRLFALRYPFPLRKEIVRTTNNMEYTPAREAKLIQKRLQRMNNANKKLKVSLSILFFMR